MKKIIVPTDFSDAAWNAFLYAVELARKTNSELLIINAYQAPHSGAGNIVSIEGILQEESELGLKEWMNKISESGFGDLEIKTKSMNDSLIDALNSLINGYDEQMVVMGSLGETGALEKLIGSNASDVVANAMCPVFVIPPDAAFSFTRKIVFAADFTRVPERINLKLLKELCLLHPSDQLEVVNVVEKDHEVLTERIDFDSFLQGLPHHIHILAGSNVAETLDNFVSESDADLLVLIKKKKGLFERIFQESVTKSLTLHASTPLLILKAQV